MTIPIGTLVDVNTHSNLGTVRTRVRSNFTQVTLGRPEPTPAVTLVDLSWAYVEDCQVVATDEWGMVIEHIAEGQPGFHAGMVVCPLCDAAPGTKCRTETGRVVANDIGCHASRCYGSEDRAKVRAKMHLSQGLAARPCEAGVSGG